MPPFVVGKAIGLVRQEHPRIAANVNLRQWLRHATPGRRHVLAQVVSDAIVAQREKRATRQLAAFELTNWVFGGEVDQIVRAPSARASDDQTIDLVVADPK